jgi:hypothetical protein
MDVDQWELLGTPGEVMPGTGYTLRNRITDRSVRYGEREYGINLVWDRVADLANVTLVRSGADEDPVRFGERLAVRVRGGGYLRYQEREYGINLVWSDGPVYEWMVGGRHLAGPVRLRQRFRIVNLEHGDYLVYGVHDFGINLRWWSDVGGYGSYPPLPLPERFRGVSGEAGQAELSGINRRVNVFHGGTDDELDWNLHLRLDADERRALFRHLAEHGPGGSASEDDLAEIECEVMVIDGYDNQAFDELWYSADVTRTLRLHESAWEYSRRAGAQQNVEGASVDAVSDLVGARLHVQGAFVNDAEHGFKPELHPIDSIAYAVGADGRVLSVGLDSAAWPTSEVVWRVGAFTNSSFHRINAASYVQRNRSTVWFLPLPSGVTAAGDANVLVRPLDFVNQGRLHDGLDDIRQTGSDRYAFAGLLAHRASVGHDPRDGTRKLEVSLSMARPGDRWGGMFLSEYRISANSGPAVTAVRAGTLDVFVRGRHDHNLVRRHYDGRNWSGWINLGGDLAFTPAVTAGGPHVLDVFVRGGDDDDLVHRYFDGQTWSGWINLGGDLA